MTSPAAASGFLLRFDAMDKRSNQLQQTFSLLIRALEDRQTDGVRTVWLTPKARKDLRALALLGGPGDMAAEVRERARPLQVPAPAPRVREEGPETAAEVAVVPGRAAGDAKRLEGAEPRAAQAVDAAEMPLQPEGETPEEKLAWLRERAADWAPIRRLDSLRETMVFAVGNPRADLVLVGEAPGAEEERRREPFVGPAGETLTKILQAMGLKRDEVYITNIVKFRPAKPNQGQSNRAPSMEEMTACLAFVRAEIDVVRPKVIVALGGTAAKGLLGEDAPVGQLRGRFWEFQGVPVMVTYHPAYLLHQRAGKAEKRIVWEDMLLVMERLGLPVSEKQRRYFL